MPQKIYSFDEVLKASTEYFHGDEFAASVFATKYSLQNSNGEFLELTPDDMHKRLASEFARIEAKYVNPMSEEEILGLLKNFRYIVPQGSPMNGIGNKFQIQSISNCFVIDTPHDSYGGILKADEEEVQIMKRRGGVGMDISSIRPKGMRTTNAAKTTDGILPYMDRFSNTCREVAQDGRRGALMLSLSCHHPQILDFVRVKKDKTRVTGANVSGRLSDEFMNAVKSGEKVQLRWPVNDKVNPIVENWVDARSIWDEIIQAAWECGEPGLLFWDTAKRMSPADAYESVGFGSTSTNPCGELVLSPGDSCRLLVINLLSFVNDPFTTSARFDKEKYADVVMKAQRLMDDMVDLELECIDNIINKINNDPEPIDIKFTELALWKRIREAAVNGRRTGLGITALGDALAAMNITYGSDESIKKTEEIYKDLAINSYMSSCIMAGERGQFPVFSFDLEKDHPFLKRVLESDEKLLMLYRKNGRRNIANTTTAPAGSLSSQTQTTSGIECAFLLDYLRRKKINPSDKDARVDFIDELGDKWQEFKVYHHGFKKWMEVTGKTNKEDSPYWHATSADVDWIKKIELQAAAQKWICHSISNTTNIPHDTPIDVVKQIYMLGWELGCKGVTVYRDGSRAGVLVTNDNALKMTKLVEHHAPKRASDLSCDIHHARIKGEDWTILVGLMDGRPYELFGGLSKFVEIPKKYRHGTIHKHPRKMTRSIYDLTFGENGDEVVIKDIINVFDNPTNGAFTRTLSLALRHGTPVQYIVEQLLKDDKDSDIFSFSRVISRVLKVYIKDGTRPAAEKSCPSCGSTDLKYQEGCVSCMNIECLWSKCG